MKSCGFTSLVTLWFVSGILVSFANQSEIDIARVVGESQQRVLRHFSSHRHYSECGFRCGDGTCLKGINKCDGVVQCTDASDEAGCHCVDRIGAKKLCDGFDDCPNGEDEAGCGLGCQEDEFSCSTSKSTMTSHCIKMSNRCDGFVHCTVTHKDEQDCFRLRSLDPKERGVVSFGLLQKRMGGKWHDICKSSEDSILIVKKHAEKTCDLVVGEVEDDPKVTTVSSKTIGSGQDDSVVFHMAHMADKERLFSVTHNCSSDQFYYVKCPDPECGWPTKKFTKHYTVEHNYKADADKYRSAAVEGLTERIVGGYDSKVGDWPFIVGIYRNGTFHCGGSIVNKEWILTAAHCTHGYEKYVFEAQVGMLRRHSYSPKEQSRMITDIIVHQRYDSKIFMNDIAMMKVDPPFHLSKWVTPACFSTDYTHDPVEKQECYVVGWGDLSEDGSGPDHLQEVKLPVLRKCMETFTNDKVQICAGIMEGGKDACQGDSGGPLICPDTNGRLTVCGLVSFGRGCARPDQAGVYTRISSYGVWIEKAMAGYYNTNKRPRGCSSKCTRSGGECIFPKNQCDGHIQCLGGEDEAQCSYRGRTVSADAYEDADEEAYAHVMRTSHADTEHVHEYGAAKLCGSTEFQCKTTKSCIPLELKCNGNFDCQDKTDEKYCECGDIIKNAHPKSFCDGLHHCLDGTDETDCEGGDYCYGADDQVRCPLSEKCIDTGRWCDGMADCDYGEDEIDCYRLMKNKGTLPAFQEGFLEDKISRGLYYGYVVVRQSSTKWALACKEEYGSSLGETVCPALGLYEKEYVLTRNARSQVSLSADEGLTTSWRRRRASQQYHSTSSYQSHCQQVKVSCEEGEDGVCGQRRLYLKADNVPKADKLGAFPWVAMILVEGEVACTATIVHKQWILASTKCLDEYIRSTTSQYVTCIGGFGQSSWDVTGVMEQTKRVNSISKLTDGLSLLHLDGGFTPDQFVTPICISSPVMDTEHTISQCVRIKVINETVYSHPVTYDLGCLGSGTNCLKYDYDKCKRSTEYFVYCEENGNWFFYGYASAENVAYCTAEGRVELINPFLGGAGRKAKETLNKPVSYVIKPPGCTGTRCSLGTCVGNKYVCDGVAHCQDWLDERRCQRHYQRLLRTYEEDGEETNYGTGHFGYGNNSSSSVATHHCPVGHFKCMMTGNCVPISAFCDGVYDCGYDDLSDEPEESLCTCKHYLELAAPEIVCLPSGESRCPDRSDQLGCPCTANSFVCNPSSANSARECIPKTMVCDSIKDCSNGNDESFCAAISTSLKHFSMDRRRRNLEGYALVRVKGSWHPYCTQEWSEEIAAKMCTFLGYRRLVRLETTDIEELYEQFPDLNFSNVTGSNLDVDEDMDVDNPLWLLGRRDFDDVAEAGPLSNSITVVASNDEEYSCQLGYITCSR